MSRSLKRVYIQYFAMLREQRGLSHEIYSTEANNPDELYTELEGQFAFSVSRSLLKVAINNEFAPWNKTLQEDDQIVFIPPVAGG